MNLKILFENTQRNFYFLLTLGLITILFTHPFLKYPFDMFTHLIRIDKYYEVTDIPKGREIWHFFWAKFFHFFSIPNSEIFLRAKIIHVLQTYIAFFSVFFFSKVVIRNIFKEIDKTILNYLSLWSVIIWFSIFATYSENYQQVWNLWYSVNYQITLPLFWYITALTVIYIFRRNIYYKKNIFYYSNTFDFKINLTSAFYGIFILSYVSFIFGIVYLDKIYYFFKKYFYIAIPIILTIIYFIKNYQPEKSKIFNYLDINKLSLLYHDIMTQGNDLISSGLNRAMQV